MRLNHAKSATFTLLVLFCLIAVTTSETSQWGDWSDWTSCSVTCGYGSVTKTGYWFDADSVKTNETYVQHSGCFFDKKCPVNGNWTMWSPYDACSKPCGYGQRTRSRECSNPRPLNGGDECYGPEKETTACKLEDCPPIQANFNLSVCSLGSKLWCTSKRMCVEKTQRCDRVVQCHDGSDEYLCYKYINSTPGLSISIIIMSLWTIFTVLVVLP